MTMNEKIANFAENYGNAFFVASLSKKKTIYVNKTARELFDITAKTCDFEKIFSSNAAMLSSIIWEDFNAVGESFLDDCSVRKADGTELSVNVQIGFFDLEQTEVYVEMIFKKDLSKIMAEFQVDKALTPEAILESDKELSLLHCNEHFYSLFDCTKSTFEEKFNFKLSNAIVTKSKLAVMEKIEQNLAKKESYTIEFQITTPTEQKKWIALTIQKRNLGNSEKYMAYLSNIDEKVEIKEKCSTLEQYMSIMQEATNDIVYRVDLKTQTLYHSSDFSSVHGFDQSIPDYINAFLKGNVIHPDDKGQYLENLQEFNNGGNPQTTVRFSLESREYQWYRITGKHIFDSNGEPVEVLGTLVNVHQEHISKKKASALTDYFDVFQSISGESFFRIDVKRKTLVQSGQVAEELGLISGSEVADFPESLLYKVHPDDLQSYKTFTENSMKGVAGSTQLRMKTPLGEYLWYGVTCGIVRDQQGDIKEVVGRMTNIQTQKRLECENSTLNQYYQAVQSLSGESIYIVDIQTKIMKSHGITETELGLPQVVSGYPEAVLDLIYADDLENFKFFTVHALDGTESHLTLRIRNKDRNYQWYELNSMIIRDDDGNPREVLGKIKNIQQQKDLEARASHDLMTKVLNKVSFEEAVATSLSNSVEGLHHAVIFIDLDDFKGINDNLGHDFGDFLLTTVGKRLKRVVRESDLIGRLGGDEFAVMLKSIGNAEAAELRVKLLLETLQRPFSFEGKTVGIKASLGFALYPEHGKYYKELIKKADIALYSSKGKGKNIATMYSSDLEEY